MEEQKTINEGGSAFPRQGFETGMTLRDYFAGQAIAGAIGGDSPSAIARRAYKIADAMLIQKQKNGQAPSPSQ